MSDMETICSFGQQISIDGRKVAFIRDQSAQNGNCVIFSNGDCVCHYYRHVHNQLITTERFDGALDQSTE